MSNWQIGVQRAPARERIYDAIALLLLTWPAVGGMFLMASTRVWGYAPGLAVVLIGAMLVWSRPLVFPQTPRWFFPPGFFVFALLTAWVAASIWWADVPYAARWQALRWLGLLAAGFAWTQLGGQAHRWKWLLGVLLLAAALNSLYAIVQHVNASRMVLWAVRPEQYEFRASGTYLCPNHLANMLAMLAPLALAALILPEAGLPLRLMALYFLAVSSPVLYWTHSRSGWLGWIGGLGVFVLLLAWRRRVAWFITGLFLAPILAGAVGFAAWRTLPAVRERMGAVIENPEAAGGIRMQMWRDVPAMIRDRPWTGFGGGSFVWNYPPYRQRTYQHLTWDYLHNEYLQVWVEYGTVGFSLLLLGVVVVTFSAMRAIRRARSRPAALLLAGAAGALAANLIHAVFDFNFHIFPNPHALVWIAGVAWGVWRLEERGPDLPDSRRRRLARMPVAAAAAIGCALAAWIAISAGMSYTWNLRADLARSRLDWDHVEEQYLRAARWDDWNWRPHLGLGHFKATRAIWYHDLDAEAESETKRQLSQEAIGHFSDSLARNPHEMAAKFGIARSFNAMGRTEEALEHIREAARMYPRHVFYREQVGLQLRRMGRHREALEAFRQNIEDGVASDTSRMNIRTLERLLTHAEAPPPDTETSF